MPVLRCESGDLLHLNGGAVLIEVFRRNVHIIVPNDCAVCCLCSQEERQAFERGEDWLLKQGTGIINTLRAAGKGDKQSCSPHARSRPQQSMQAVSWCILLSLAEWVNLVKRLFTTGLRANRSLCWRRGGGFFIRH